MKLHVATDNSNAQLFDELTDRLVAEIAADDDQVIVITLQFLIARLLKLQRHWPEDILAFADYVSEKHDVITTAERRKKNPIARAILTDFLDNQAHHPMVACL